MKTLQLSIKSLCIKCKIQIIKTVPLQYWWKNKKKFLVPSER